MLENKLGIIDAVELARQEERLSKKEPWRCLKVVFG